MRRGRSVIDGTAEHVQDTSINPRAKLSAQPDIQFLGVLVLEILNRPDIQIPEVIGHPSADARDGLKLSQHRLFRHGEPSFQENKIRAEPM